MGCMIQASLYGEGDAEESLKMAEIQSVNIRRRLATNICNLAAKVSRMIVANFVNSVMDQ